jgi:preprotein translocase subunit SecD
MKWYSIIKEWRITLMIIFLIISLLVIRPQLQPKGVLVTSASAPAGNYIQPGSIIISVNGYEVNNVTDYQRTVSLINPGDTVIITYKVEESAYNYATKNTYPFIALEEDNQTNLGLSVAAVPFSNLEFGLDLSGGTKVILKPEEEVTKQELVNIMGILEQRLNVYGFKEIPINQLSDFSGNDYIRVELPASVSVEGIQELLEHEGVFEARIGNKTVFTGEDILSVCITGVDCVSRVRAVQGGSVFEFQLTISEEGADKFANVTSYLSIAGLGDNCYLNETISFYLDSELLEGSELNIGCNLQGVPERSPVISGGAQSAETAREEMKRLKSMLQTKNLPVGLSIESVEIISPKLGQEFLNNIIFVFLLAILSVDVIIALRYKSLKIALPIIFVTLSEILITLGVATLFTWTFDLAAIAGLIASVGTGVDDQIVITDEVMSRDRSDSDLNFKQRIKRAFFIVFATFTTSIAVMIPLTTAGAGILRGFAITTIIAISVGVLITRPAYARMLELIFAEKT